MIIRPPPSCSAPATSSSSVIAMPTDRSSMPALSHDVKVRSFAKNVLGSMRAAGLRATRLPAVGSPSTIRLHAVCVPPAEAEPRWLKEGSAKLHEPSKLHERVRCGPDGTVTVSDGADSGGTACLAATPPPAVTERALSGDEPAFAAGATVFIHSAARTRSPKDKRCAESRWPPSAATCALLSLVAPAPRSPHSRREKELWRDMLRDECGVERSEASVSGSESSPPQTEDWRETWRVHLSAGAAAEATVRSVRKVPSLRPLTSLRRLGSCLR
mmetsp:Transcript_37452/g.121811  ORF Transcript_37452/g.121811 Transcript_37452/m.121811 type:complete len:272 (-) Transcript_37452:1685-2500(-)